MDLNLIHPAALPIEQLMSDCSITHTRGSGPGGQHRNKVATAVVVQHQRTGIIGQASERRSQQQNRAVAISRLRVNLAVAFRTLPPREAPSARWRQRVAQAKLRVNREHFDYAAILAEALDTIAGHNCDVSAAAKDLKISVSQLVKFLKTCPPALTWVNQQRENQGLKALR